MATKAKIPFAEQLAIRCQPYFDELKNSTVEETKSQLGDLYKGLSDALKYFEDALAEKAAEDMDKAFTDITTEIDKYLNERESTIQETLDDMSVNVAKLTDDITEVKDNVAEVKESIENPPENPEDEMEADADSVSARKSHNIFKEYYDLINGKSKWSKVLNWGSTEKEDNNDIKKLTDKIGELSGSIDKASKVKKALGDLLHDLIVGFILWLITKKPADNLVERMGEGAMQAHDRPFGPGVDENGNFDPAVTTGKHLEQMANGADDGVPTSADFMAGQLVKGSIERRNKRLEERAQKAEAEGNAEKAASLRAKIQDTSRFDVSTESTPKDISKYGPGKVTGSGTRTEPLYSEPVAGFDMPFIIGTEGEDVGRNPNMMSSYASYTNATVLQINSRQDAHND